MSSLETQISLNTTIFAFCLKCKTLKKTRNFAFCLRCKILTAKGIKMHPKKTKNSRGRIGAAHFVVAFLKSHPKPEAGPYDIRTIVFEQGNLEV